jgi:hypothetical protein
VAKDYFVGKDLDFSGLLAARRRGLRNGNWRRLPLVDRGLFRCALWVATAGRNKVQYTGLERSTTESQPTTSQHSLQGKRLTSSTEQSLRK